MRNNFLSFILVLLYTIEVNAQTDSARLAKYPTSYNTEYGIDRNRNGLAEDTLLRRNEIYHPLYRNYGLFQDLGNIGTPSRSLVFDPTRNTDFSLGFNPWAPYYKTPDKTRYYHTRVPYADIHYVQGPMDLLLLTAKFSVNVTPRLNIGVDYDRVTSLGFYPRQYTSAYYTNLNTSYSSKNKRYALLANVNFNRGVLDESGGIVSDSLFETLRTINKAVPVNLLSSQSRYRNAVWYAKQYFYAGKMNRIINGEDTSYESNQASYFSHTIRYDRDRFAFDNPDGDTSSILFPGKANDTAAFFFDSITSFTFMNRIAYGYRTAHPGFIEFAIAHKYIQVRQFSMVNTYHNVWAEAGMERIPEGKNKIGIKVNGSYCMSGYNVNDTRVSGDVKYISGIFDLVAGAGNQLYTPDYTQVYFNNEAFSWVNRFSKINILNWHAGIATKMFRNNVFINFNQYIINNWVYNDVDVKPVQTNRTILVNTIDLNKTFRAWIFYFENRLMLQHTTGDILRLPAAGVNLRYYVNGFLFKRALQLQLGASLFYNTAYYANAYNPAARVFHLQNEVVTGNYPLVDVFVTGQIKKAILFAKLEHANMNVQNTGFYYTPHYPLPVRAFRIGVRWRMYN